MYFNLGPAQTAKNLRTFRLTGGESDYEGDDPPCGISMQKGRQVKGLSTKVVEAIPDSVVKVRE